MEVTMKLIAKTQKGTEYLHSKQYAYFAPDASAEKICGIMNKIKYKLNSDNELWYVYDYDFSDDAYVTHRLRIYKGIVKICQL